MKKVLSGLFLATLSFYSQAADKAVVLMYHSITEKTTDMNTTPEHFQQQMDYLKKNNFNVISSLELVNKIENKTPFSEKTVVITFDDGWASQKTAMDKLAVYHYPATFALVTEYQMYKNKTYLQKEDFEHYKDEPFTYVNHSRTHFTKDFLGNPVFDVKMSKYDIVKTTGEFIPLYVYPYGLKSPKLIKELKKNGYKAAFGVAGAPVNINKVNIFNINRFQINDAVSIDNFVKIVNKAI